MFINPSCPTSNGEGHIWHVNQRECAKHLGKHPTTSYTPTSNTTPAPHQRAASGAFVNPYERYLCEAGILMQNQEGLHTPVQGLTLRWIHGLIFALVGGEGALPGCSRTLCISCNEPNSGLWGILTVRKVTSAFLREYTNMHGEDMCMCTWFYL